MPLPTEPERAFVKGIDNEYYIQKLILCCKTQKYARVFKHANEMLTRPRLLRFPV